MSEILKANLHLVPVLKNIKRMFVVIHFTEFYKTFLFISNIFVNYEFKYTLTASNVIW